MRKQMIIWLLVLYVAVPVLLSGNNYILSLLNSSLIIAGLAVSWALLGNLGGMVSFGHAAFFGIGGYASALLVSKLGVPVIVAIPAAGLVAVGAAALMLPVLRLSGPYFALAILAYAHIFKILATEFSSLTGGSAGLTSIAPLPNVLGLDLSSRLGAYFLVVSLVLAFCWHLALLATRSM